MENNRNWQGWVALALAGMALLVALMGRSSGRDVLVSVVPNAGQVQAQPAQPDPRFGGRDWRDNSQVQPAVPQQRPDELRGFEHRGPGFGPGAFEHGHRGDFGPGRHGFPFFLPFMLFNGSLKLAGVALIVWLLVRFFRSRRDRPQPPSTPTTQV